MRTQSGTRYVFRLLEESFSLMELIVQCFGRLAIPHSSYRERTSFIPSPNLKADAMSIDLERQPPVRFDSQATKVEDEEESDEKTSRSESDGPRFSFSHASHSDNPYSVSLSVQGCTIYSSFILRLQE